MDSMELFCNLIIIQAGRTPGSRLFTRSLTWCDLAWRRCNGLKTLQAQYTPQCFEPRLETLPGVLSLGSKHSPVF